MVFYIYNLDHTIDKRIHHFRYVGENIIASTYKTIKHKNLRGKLQIQIKPPTTKKILYEKLLQSQIMNLFPILNYKDTSQNIVSHRLHSFFPNFK